jgi:nitric oxide reductase NorE protein
MTSLADSLPVTDKGDAMPAPGKFIAGTPDIWFFVFFEAFLFTGYFTVYMVQRALDATAFLQSQANLSLATGCINTLILLASSWSMARCVQASREGATAAAMKNAVLTIAFALAFLIVKVYEWSVEIGRGYTFTTSEFFSFYYFLTSIHFIHLLIGFIFLGVVVYQLASPARRSQSVIETGAVYWHMVDFLWIMIFALLYLTR